MTSLPLSKYQTVGRDLLGKKGEWIMQQQTESKHKRADLVEGLTNNRNSTKSRRRVYNLVKLEHTYGITFLTREHLKCMPSLFMRTCVLT